MSTHALIVWLFCLMLSSAFFSGSEVGMMAINRYRLRHLAKKSQLARVVSSLLERPDRLLGVILMGNTFANILMSSIATMLTVRLFGEEGAIISVVVLTVVVLIFAEIAPKTVAAMNPQRFAFFSAWPLRILLKIFYPLIWLINGVANGMLRIFGIKVKQKGVETLTRDELRIIVSEAMSSKVTSHHQSMLLRLIDLEEVTVDDVIVQRNDIYGIDIEEDWDTIWQKVLDSPHSWVPVYAGNIENVQGMLYSHHVLRLLSENTLNKESLMQAVDEVYYVPEGTSLTVQLANFRDHPCPVGMVVDEYGDIQGLLAVADILEEIVGEFASEKSDVHFQKEKGGSYLIAGVVNLRDLNRALKWELPTNGPKTLNGLITEHLESIPHGSVCVIIAGYKVEVVSIKDNAIKVARIYPRKESAE